MATVFSLMGQSTSRSNQAGQGNHSGAPVPEGPQAQAFGEILAAGQMNLSSLSPEGRLPPGIVVAADLTAGKTAESAVVGQVGEAEVAEFIASVSGNSLPQGDQGLPHMVSLQLPPNTSGSPVDSDGVQGEGVAKDGLALSQMPQGHPHAVQLGNPAQSVAGSDIETDTAVTTVTPESSRLRSTAANLTTDSSKSFVSRPALVPSVSDQQAVMPSAIDVTTDSADAATTARSVSGSMPAPSGEPGDSSISAGVGPSDTKMARSGGGDQASNAHNNSLLNASQPRTQVVTPSASEPTLPNASQAGTASAIAVQAATDSATTADSTDIAKMDHRNLGAQAYANGPSAPRAPGMASPERSDVANFAVASAQQRPAMSSDHKRSDSDRGSTNSDSSGVRIGAVVADQARPVLRVQAGTDQQGATRPAAQQIEPAVFNASSSATTTATTVDSAQKSASFAKDMELLSAAGGSDSADSGIKNALASLSQTSSSSAKPLPQFTISQPVSLSPGWEQAMAGRVVWMGAQGVQSANLTLNPQDLGAIQIQVDISGDQASVQFQAQSTETCDLIEKLMPRLSHALEGQGLKLEESKVSQFTPSQDSSNAQQAANQSAGRQGGEGANQRSRADSANPSLMGQEPADELVQSTISPLSSGVDYYA